MRSFLLLALLSFFAVPNSYADNRLPMTRFEPWLEALEKVVYSSSDPEKVAKKSIDGMARIAAFNLQALCKIYSDKDKKFENHLEQFKAVEDMIGRVDMWENAKKAAEKKLKKAEEKKDKKDIAKFEKKIKEIKEEIKDATKKLEKFYDKNNWVRKNRDKSYLSEFRGFLEKYDWASKEKDKDFIVENLREELDKILKKDYDFRYLEEHNGIHELRRNIRWFVIKARVVNGLVAFRDHDNSCPIEAYRPLLRTIAADPASEKYRELQKPSDAEKPYACKISKCLFYAAIDLVNKIGAVKDKAEHEHLTGNSDSDKVTKEEQDFIEQLWRETLEQELLPTLREELKACK